MQRHYKGEITIALDSWGEDEFDAIDNYLWKLWTKQDENDANILDYDLDCIEEDDTDDVDYQLDCEYENYKERMNDSTD